MAIPGSIVNLPLQQAVTEVAPLQPGITTGAESGRALFAEALTDLMTNAAPRQGVAGPAGCEPGNRFITDLKKPSEAGRLNKESGDQSLGDDDTLKQTVRGETEDSPLLAMLFMHASSATEPHFEGGIRVRDPASVPSGPATAATTWPDAGADMAKPPGLPQPMSQPTILPTPPDKSPSPLSPEVQDGVPAGLEASAASPLPWHATTLIQTNEPNRSWSSDSGLPDQQTAQTVPMPSDHAFGDAGMTSRQSVGRAFVADPAIEIQVVAMSPSLAAGTRPLAFPLERNASQAAATEALPRSRIDEPRSDKGKRDKAVGADGTDSNAPTLDLATDHFPNPAQPDERASQAQRREASSGPRPGEGATGAAAQADLSEAHREAAAEQLAQGIGQRMLAEISRGSWRIEVGLHPAHLGRVDVRMHFRAGSRIDAEFDSTSDQARELLTGGLPRLREVLEQGGLSIGNLDVRGDARQHADRREPQGALAASLPFSSRTPDQVTAVPQRTAGVIGTDHLDVTV